MRASTAVGVGAGVDQLVVGALLAAWALISLGAAANFGAYRPVPVTLVAIGMLCLTAAVLTLGRLSGLREASRASGDRRGGRGGRRGRTRRGDRVMVAMAAVVAAVGAAVYPYGQYAHGAGQSVAHGLIVAAGVALVVLAVLDATPALATLVVLLAAAACVAGIIASPAPRNDVWFILQGSSHALLHGRNIYTQIWRGSPPRGITNLFPYLPGTTLLVAPFYLVVGDVRYALVAALVIAAMAVRRLSADNVGPVLCGLVMLFPRVLFGVEQSWTDPLLLALIAVMVWSVTRRRPTLATLCFGAALASKQYMFLLVPLAAVWPAFGWRRTVSALAGAFVVAAIWFAAAPRAFVHGAVTYNWDLPARLDSLSLYTSAIRAGWTPPFVLVPLIMAVVLAVALWKVPRTAAGFALGSAWLLGMFDLLNKQSFFNEWSLVVGLVIVGLAALDQPAFGPTGDGPAAGGPPKTELSARRRP